jgi:N-acetylmuramoyl-L-alanine amidase
MGVQTMMSRRGDYNKTVKQRTDEANAWGAALFLSLHRNDFVTNGQQDTTANGFETFILPNDNKGSRRFQQAIHSRLRAAGLISAPNIASNTVPATQMRDRGEKTSNFHVLRESKMPAVLVETGFIANTKDNGLFDRNLTGFDTAICNAIVDIIGRPVQPPAPPQSNIVYRVVAESHMLKSNADNTLAELRRLGFRSPFIVEFKP